MKYELCYLVGESNEPKLEEISKEVKQIIEEFGGKFEESQIIEKRKMAYSIKKEIRGLYISQRFEASKSDIIEQATKKLNLFQDVLRFILVKADGLPKMEVYKKYAPGTEEAQKEEKKEAPQKTESKKPVAEKVEEKVEEKKEKTKEEPKKEKTEKKETKKEENEKEEKKDDKKVEKKKETKEDKANDKKAATKSAIPSDDEIDKTLEEILNI